ncbi:MAG: type II toxin-antitoxin system RelE/ParE family toxin [Eubacteriaceae bacterium]
MKFEIRYLPRARGDIIEIADYLSEFGIETAQAFLRDLEEKVLRLQEMPYIGEKYMKYRRLIIKDYLVFYRVNSEMRTVDVYRVLHGKRNLNNYL